MTTADWFLVVMAVCLGLPLGYYVVGPFLGRRRSSRGGR